MCRAVAGSACRWGARRGACPAGRRLTVPFRNPQGGGLPFGLPAAPDFSLLFCPPSPKGKDRPPAPFPSGEGGDQGYFMQGAPPLASPGAEPGRHWERGQTTRPAGGLHSLSPVCPDFSLLFCPHPPDPLPGGKGEPKVISCKGLRPLHPRAEPGRHWGRGQTTRPARACSLRYRLDLTVGHPAGRHGGC